MMIARVAHLIGRKVLQRKSGQAILAVLGLVGIYLGLLQLSGNFHTVIAGELYRSAQPSSAAIEENSRTHGIRTIVNLRGAKPGRRWYEEEIATSRRLGIAHVDFPMSSRRELKQSDAAKLLDILQKAQRPILIHCQAGADRTGLAAALYLAQIAKAGEERAEGQISLYFGHIGLPLISPAYAIDRGWEKLEPWLGFPNS
jgi:protein tyrosine/serine phosphatase